MKFGVVGPAYKHPSIDANFQRCVNQYVTSSGPEGRGTEGKDNNSVLLPTAGAELLVNLGVNPVRCMGTVGDSVYVVTGASVYKLVINDVTSTVTSSTLIGTITSSSEGQVYMAANPTQVIWVDGTSSGYIYTLGTGVFQEITATDADFPGGGQVKFIDSYFVVFRPDSGLFYTSAQNNGLSWDALDVATAESSTDNIVGMGISKGELWLMGTNTTEIWFNQANPTGMPLSPRVGLQMQIGCGAPASIVQLNDLLIWLDNRGFIVQSAVSGYIRSNNSGYDLQIVSDAALTAEIATYSRIDDAIGGTYNYNGHLMYQITFPTDKKTWVFDYLTKVWHERTWRNSYLGEDEHHLGQFFTETGTLKLMAGIRDGKIYISSSQFLTDEDEQITRIRTTSPQFDPEGHKLIGVDNIDLRMETGEAAQGLNPNISLRYSNDGGHTWSDSMSRSFGQVGQYGKPITWNRLGTAREWIFEFTIVEPVAYSIIDATAIITVEKE